MLKKMMPSMSVPPWMVSVGMRPRRNSVPAMRARNSVCSVLNLRVVQQQQQWQVGQWRRCFTPSQPVPLASTRKDLGSVMSQAFDTRHSGRPTSDGGLSASHMLVQRCNMKACQLEPSTLTCTGRSCATSESCPFASRP